MENITYIALRLKNAELNNSSARRTSNISNLSSKDDGPLGAVGCISRTSEYAAIPAISRDIADGSSPVARN